MRPKEAIQSIITRLGCKSPLAFRFINALSASSLFICGIPEFVNAFSLPMPHLISLEYSRIVTFFSGIFWLTGGLTIDKKNCDKYLKRTA
jgi:hypothetical protein